MKIRLSAVVLSVLLFFSVGFVFACHTPIVATGFSDDAIHSVLVSGSADDIGLKTNLVTVDDHVINKKSSCYSGVDSVDDKAIACDGCRRVSGGAHGLIAAVSALDNDNSGRFGLARLNLSAVYRPG